MYQSSLNLLQMFSKCSRVKNLTNVIWNRAMANKPMSTVLDKKTMDKYYRLPIPDDKVLATYVWIDGSGINMRSKDRIMRSSPQNVSDIPKWSFDGSSTGQATTSFSDIILKPVAIYPDPFRMSPHVLVLCETYTQDGNPCATNNRKFLMDQLEKHSAEEPWFGLEQEYTLLDIDNWGLGWPKGGFPTVNYKFSYCGVGAKYIVGRDITEAHARCCLYSGLDFEGTNAEVMMGSWEWQVGTSVGEKAADDLWVSRYIMARITEDYGAHVTYHPKPMGPEHPGIGLHHNFSTKPMRTKGGYKVIEEAIEKLKNNHAKHMKKYGLGDGETNKLRLTGKFETSSFDKFAWGVSDRNGSVRVQKTVVEKDMGFFEDRRPAGDCDPYLVCGLILETCMSK